MDDERLRGGVAGHVTDFLSRKSFADGSDYQ